MWVKDVRTQWKHTPAVNANCIYLSLFRQQRRIRIKYVGVLFSRFVHHIFETSGFRIICCMDHLHIGNGLVACLVLIITMLVFIWFLFIFTFTRKLSQGRYSRVWSNYINTSKIKLSLRQIKDVYTYHFYHWMNIPNRKYRHIPVVNYNSIDFRYNK